MAAENPAPHSGEEHHRDDQPRHEEDRVSARGVLLMGVILAGVVIGSMTFLTLLQKRLAVPAQEVPAAWRSEERAPVEYDQPAQLKALNDWENSVLREYAWQDNEQTVARIPVERAQQMLVEQGFPFQQRELSSEEEAQRE